MVALAAAPIASAAPSNDSWVLVWDIEEYDRCLKFGYGEDVNCCIDSGGRWDGPNAGSGKCVAPDPPESESSAPGKGTRLPGPRRPFVVPGSLLDSLDIGSAPGPDDVTQPDDVIQPDGQLY